MKKRILVIGSECVNKYSEDFADHHELFFQTEFLSQGSIKMINVPPLRFQQCLGPFTMLLVQGYSEALLL